MISAVFFDRDNTLVKNVPYNGDPDKVELLPHVREALDQLQKYGFSLFLVTNQSGVGRGLITREQVKAVNDEMIRQLGKPYFKDIYMCFDDPARPLTNCRKPSPHMILQAGKDHKLDLSQSFFIGDKLADIRAGHNAGCKSVLFIYQQQLDELTKIKQEADFASNDLLEIADWICTFTKKK
ncbi:HAD family hydrolase [candidate division KSB1 bacterium]|nr:HAD family hydrolase [candidate division KSB1 bacterium]